MSVTKLFHRVLLSLLCVGILGVGAAPAWAQQPTEAAPVEERTASLANEETTLWLFEGPTLQADQLTQLQAELKAALSNDQGTHIIGDEAFNSYVSERRPSPPECLKGAMICTSPTSMVFDALQLALVIEVKVRRADNQLEAAYTLKDRRTDRGATVSIARGASPRQLALALVREIYNATGIVELTSVPPGARVMIDGADIGTTPLKHRLPVGAHSYQISFPQHRTASGEVEISTTQPSTMEVKLEALPGLLLLENVPPGALVYINDQPPRDAAQPLELPSGKYNLEIKAPNHESRREQITIVAGESISRDGALKRLNPLLRDISKESIVLNRYTLRLSYDHALQWTTFRGARGSDDQLGLEYEFRRHVRNANDELEPRRLIDPNGLRIEAAYHWENVGLTLLSLGYISDSRTQSIEVEDLKTGQRQSATLDRVRKLQFKPIQLSYRLFYNNLVPFAELGMGFNFQWLDIRVAQLPQTIIFSQTEALMSAGIGTQYFFSPRWFASARYNAHIHFNEGVGTEHVISLGVGAAFPNFFGVEPEPPAKIE